MIESDLVRIKHPQLGLFYSFRRYQFISLCVLSIFRRLTWLRQVSDAQWKIDLKDLQFMETQAKSVFLTNVRKAMLFLN